MVDKLTNGRFFRLSTKNSN